MNETISGYSEEILRGMIDFVPAEYQILFSLLIYTSFIVVYSVFIWKFYKFLASREIIHLNLKQYNHSSNPFLEKLFAVALYTIEYLIILPFLVFFWFAVFSSFLMVLSQSENTFQILLISASIIASTRITAYISEELSGEVAKVFPLTILAMFIVDPNLLNAESLLNKITQIPSMFNNVLIFIVFIFIIEFALRLLSEIYEFYHSDDEEDED